ncbi:DUF4242 domain-containing protein [Arenibacter aquaticus]|uniref:DUF4242 domain-containing protein n=1 Tax=Arenibacter aquaticus TaxID=2489054 RepID=A0A3S0ACH3_9FLAO|nr:nickel-binding protein [Arenibacter aquaticus]RTE52311.1 DUF4242 domain-containing protein [Arenibacter aquaticus]
MPLFMDRHYIKGATSEEVAKAHHEDMKIQSKYHCKALTYWHDEVKGVAFCLIEAPSASAVRCMHKEAHGLIPNQIIEVDGQAVAQFLDRVIDPENEDGKPMTDNPFRAIMFIDMVSSTDITKALGDSKALVLVHRYRDVVRKALVDHGGREVDRAGDGFLTSFRSAYMAALCAVEIQRQLALYNESREDGILLQARIGIGAGEPVQDGDALFGSTINLVARICSYGNSGQIVTAKVVKDLCIGKDISFKSLGPQTLKGFDEPIDLELIQW